MKAFHRKFWFMLCILMAPLALPAQSIYQLKVYGKAASMIPYFSDSVFEKKSLQEILDLTKNFALKATSKDTLINILPCETILCDNPYTLKNKEEELKRLVLNKKTSIVAKKIAKDYLDQKNNNKDQPQSILGFMQASSCAQSGGRTKQLEGIEIDLAKRIKGAMVGIYEKDPSLFILTYGSKFTETNTKGNELSLDKVVLNRIMKSFYLDQEIMKRVKAAANKLNCEQNAVIEHAVAELINDSFELLSTDGSARDYPFATSPIKVIRAIELDEQNLYTVVTKGRMFKIDEEEPSQLKEVIRTPMASDFAIKETTKGI